MKGWGIRASGGQCFCKLAQACLTDGRLHFNDFGLFFSSKWKENK